MASYFGEYTPNDPRSFDLHPNITLLPQFFFNLRRSHFVQVCACSQSTPLTGAVLSLEPKSVARWAHKAGRLLLQPPAELVRQHCASSCKGLSGCSDKV